MMNNEYICDDRNQIEHAEWIRNMTDEEWEEYVRANKQKEDESQDE